MRGTAAVLIVVLGFAVASVEAQRFDARGRRIPVPQGAPPLLAGPPNPSAWAVPRGFGQQFPLLIDRDVLYSERLLSYRIVLPRPGPPGNDVVVVVDDVRNDAGAIDRAIVRSVPGLRVPVAYSGVVRGSASGVAVVSIIGGVLYGRVVQGSEAWTLFSSPGGRPYVRIDRAGQTTLPPQLLPRR